MIEAIILSTLTCIAGFFVGAFAILSRLNSRVKTITLDNGNKIHVWKGFVDPSYTFVTVSKDGGLDGDGVVFDKEGNIIHVETHVKT